MTDFCKQIRDLGLQIMITEFDVDDLGVPAPQVKQAVANKYGEFLDIMGPYVSAITFEALRDKPALPKNPDGTPTLSNLFDTNYEPVGNYFAVVKSLERLSPPGAKR
jgi:hypothetical protein